ncbi:MAG: permease prefix domain 1-containing protein [Jatrophihabitans sp.]|uniref:permease prefix domain 1-containing protein n=1 Tax=Jatrophihabitans sp. TaxID=1932789 RepID=UPI003F818FF4
MSATPIEDFLDEVLRRTRHAPRSCRRLLDETGDHLYSLAADLEAGGMTRVDAEREALRRLGPLDALAPGLGARPVGQLAAETARAALRLAGWGLVAIGVSGVVVALMNAVAGDGFVGGVSVLGFGRGSQAESAGDAVSLRLLAGVLGLVLLGLAAAWRARRPRLGVLPDGLVDALGAAAFTAATAALTGASIDQAVVGGSSHGVGFFLSGAVVALAAAVGFSVRAVRSLLGGA